MNAKTISISLGLAVSSVAAAQDIWFSLVSWQVSQDEGHTWHGGTVEIADPFARVRIRATVDWEYPGSYALSQLRMDVTITYGAGFGDDDRVVSPAPIPPFDSLVHRTYVATRFGHIIKIDDARDTLPPGVGSLWIDCMQLPEIFNPNFSTQRPAPAFEFLLQLDGTHGLRTVNHVNPLSMVGEELGPRVYLTPDGQQGIPRTVRRAPLNLVVVPAPGALSLGVLAFLVRRRRPPHAPAPPRTFATPTARP